MQNLHADFCAINLVNRLSDDTVMSDLPREAQLRGKRTDTTCQVRCNATGHHQPHAACCTRLEIFRHAFITVFGFFQARVHGPHQYPVFQFCKAQVNGLKKM